MTGGSGQMKKSEALSDEEKRNLIGLWMACTSFAVSSKISSGGMKWEIKKKVYEFDNNFPLDRKGVTR